MCYLDVTDAEAVRVSESVDDGAEAAQYSADRSAVFLSDDNRIGGGDRIPHHRDDGAFVGQIDLANRATSRRDDVVRCRHIRLDVRPVHLDEQELFRTRKA